MKLIIVILSVVVLSMLTVHCKMSTEQKMIKRINETSLYNRSRIIKVDVLDTIYQSDIDRYLKLDTIKLEFLNYRYQIFDSLKDEVRRKQGPDFNDKYSKSVFDSLMMYDRWIEMVKDKDRTYERISSYNENDIIGYRVVVQYKDGRTNDITIQSDYTFLCSYFMFEPIDSMIKFTPDFRRHGPRTNRPDFRRMSIDRPRDFRRFNTQTNGIQ